MTHEELAKQFNGILTAPEPVIRERFEQDMAQDVIVSAEERGMLKTLPLDTQKEVRKYLFRGYLAGWTESEIYHIERKGKK